MSKEQFLQHKFDVFTTVKTRMGVEGAVRGLEGTHPADSCILTKLE
jgi:hypothetical protein